MVEGGGTGDEMIGDEMIGAYNDPGLDFSYLDEKLQITLGHFQKDFEGGVTPENLGEKFGGYGSFLPRDHSQPMTPKRSITHLDEKLQITLGHFQKDFEGGVTWENLGEKFGGYGSFLPRDHSQPMTPKRSIMHLQSTSVWSRADTPQKVQKRNAPWSSHSIYLKNNISAPSDESLVLGLRNASGIMHGRSAVCAGQSNSAYSFVTISPETENSLESAGVESVDRGLQNGSRNMHVRSAVFAARINSAYSWSTISPETEKSWENASDDIGSSSLRSTCGTADIYHSGQSSKRSIKDVNDYLDRELLWDSRIR